MSTDGGPARAASRVAILLATHDGGRYLPAQLDSLAAQEYPHWQVWASDDGSSDDTPAILEQRRQDWPNGRLHLLAGPGQGSTANFLGLAAHTGIAADYFAFADQDDLWDADKLVRAVAWLDSQPRDLPALYCGRTRLIDAAGRPLGQSPLYRRPPSFANALVQNIAGGNTMVFNQAARRLIALGDPTRVVVHDWWAYLIVAGAGGRVHFDPLPALSYRQHGANLIGSGAGLRAWLGRAAAMLQGRQRAWHERHLSMLTEVEGELGVPQRAVLAQFLEARDGGPWQRLRGLRAAGIYRQTASQDAFLLLAAVLGRI
jgi:glycosyltransferase involved in cell wall biosynthesis